MVGRGVDVYSHSLCGLFDVIDRLQLGSVSLNLFPGDGELQRANSCHGDNDLGFGVRDALKLLILINTHDCRDYAKESNNEPSIQSMTIMLASECHTDNQSAAKKNGHEHFHLIAFCSESLPA